MLFSISTLYYEFKIEIRVTERKTGKISLTYYVDLSDFTKYLFNREVASGDKQ